MTDFQRPFRLPAGATELVLVRHGSSTRPPADSDPPLIGGRHDPPLSELGRAQAELVRDRLESLPADGLFVTPLRRTSETAAPLAAATGREPTVVEDLREVHLGDWEGRLSARTTEGDPLAADVFDSGRWDLIPNAEPTEAFAARIARGIDHVAAAVGPDAVGVAVVHGGVIAEACRHATDSHPFAFLFAENGSLTRLVRYGDGRWALRSFNDVTHLASLA